jgi:hypothetical protein
MIKEIDLIELGIDLIDLAWQVVKALGTAITSLWENGDAATKIGLAIAGLIAISKITGLASKFKTALKTSWNSNLKDSYDGSSIGLKTIQVLAALKLIYDSDTIGTSIGKFFAELAGDKKLAAYYEEYCTWDKIFPELKSALEDGTFWSGLWEMLKDSYYSFGSGTGNAIRKLGEKLDEDTGGLPPIGGGSSKSFGDDGTGSNTGVKHTINNITNNNNTTNNNGDNNDLSGAGTHILGSYSGNTDNNTTSNNTTNNNTTNNITNQYGTASGSASSQAVDYGIKSSIEQSRKNIQQATDGEIGKYTKEVTKSMEGSAKQLQEAGKSMVKALGDGISSEVKKLAQGSGSTGSSGFSSGFGYGINKVTSSSQTYDFIFKVNGQEASNSLFGRYNKEFEDINKNLGGTNKNSTTSKKIIYNVDARQTGVDSSSTTLTDAFDSLLNSVTGIPSNTSLNVNLGGDMNNASDITSWASRFSTLTNVWKDSSSTLSAKVGGDMTSINDTDNWKSKFKTLKDEWTGKTATFNSEYKNSDTKSSGYSAFNGLKSAWKGTTATFDSTYKNSSTSSTGYSNLQALKKNWTGRTAQFDGKYVNASTSAQGYKDFNNLWQNWYGRTATFTVGFNTDASGIKSLANTLLEKIETAINNAFATSNVMKNNKVVFKRYATGGVADKATLGIFGEAGTEAIVPLENNLGWLNKMSDMMIEGMEDSTKLKYTASPSSLGFNQSNVYSAMTSNDELVSEQNRLLEEQNDLLRQILDKPSGISSRDVFNAVQGESNSYYNRTGNSPFLF